MHAHIYDQNSFQARPLCEPFCTTRRCSIIQHSRAIYCIYLLAGSDQHAWHLISARGVRSRTCRRSPRRSLASTRSFLVVPVQSVQQHACMDAAGHDARPFGPHHGAQQRPRAHARNEMTPKATDRYRSQHPFRRPCESADARVSSPARRLAGVGSGDNPRLIFLIPPHHSFDRPAGQPPAVHGNVQAQGGAGRLRCGAAASASDTCVCYSATTFRSSLT